MTRLASIFCLMAFTIFTSCKEEAVPEIFNPSSAYEAYVYSLEQMDLIETELGRQFINASEKAMFDPIAIETPYQEQFYIHAESPKAYSYKFEAKRGEKVNIQINPARKKSARLFIDLFRIEIENDRPQHIHIASADENNYQLGFEPRQTSNYILRVQAELLHSGDYTISIVNKASYDFPVSGKDAKSIGSFFGDPRDGGRREHHGIDIFAARHTPIICPASGLVRFAGEKGLGGRVVWLRDEMQERTLYFAHLESIYVETGDHIAAGDTIGTVGNTGNARTTPPHLHFGIYQRGPIDPYDFVANQQPSLKKISIDSLLIGSNVRLVSNRTLNVWPQDTTFMIPKHQVVKIEAGVDQKYRVRMPNGQYTFLRHQDIEPLDRPIAEVEHVGAIFSEPDASSAIINRVEKPATYNVLGLNQHFRFVQLLGTNHGWIKNIAL